MDYRTFRKKFIKPISAGQAPGAKQSDRQLMVRRLCALQDETSVSDTPFAAFLLQLCEVAPCAGSLAYSEMDVDSFAVSTLYNV